MKNADNVKKNALSVNDNVNSAEQKKSPTGDELRELMKKNGATGQGGGRGPGRNVIVEKPKDAKGTLLKLFRYIGKSKYLVIIGTLASLATTGIGLLLPKFQGGAIDAITLTEGKLDVDFDSLVRFLVLMAVAAFASALFQLIQGILSTKISQTTVYTMREDLFKKISRLPISYTDNHAHGDIMSRMTNDVDNVSATISSSISSLISAVITLVGAFILIIGYDWRIALISLVTIPLTFFVSLKLSKYMRKYFVERQVILGEMNTDIEEMVSGYKTVVAYGKEDDACDEFEEKSERFRKCSIRANVWGGVMGPAMNIINNLNYLLVTTASVYFATIGVISIGDIQSILQYSRSLAQPINQISNQYASILTAIAGAERVFSILETEDEIDEGKNPMAIDDVKGNIEFKDVCFSYVPGKQVLNNFCLSVKQGEKIALVGATGSGKTTIVNLLTRFYELDSGEITVEGVNITEIPKDVLRGAIAIVLQDTVLFHDTIGNNIKYGKPDASYEEIRHAADVSESDEFIERLPEQYDTMIVEGGGNISQGQSQLISISRAVLADPKILILDEATSSVDTRTEMHIQEAMIALMKNRTSFIIAHRLSTIRDADKIVVLDNGRVAEIGNHDELLERKGAYYKLYSTQYAGIAT